MAKDDPNSTQWRRFLRLQPPSSKQVKAKARRLETLTIRHAHRFIISRWANLRDVRRHAIGWVVLASLLIIVTMLQLVWAKSPYVQQLPSEGGMYAEGVIGRLDTLNPIYASTQSERSASKLIFSSLMRYDSRNNLEGDLAQSYTRSDDGKTYTVSMRRDASWHDGKRVTADDVEFTVRLIKNPVSRSYLYKTWQDIKVEKKDRYTITFNLPSAYSPFPHIMTFGILPKHILETTAPARMREHPFNRDPVGSGPFVFRDIQTINPSLDRSVLQMARNDSYYRGPIKLERFQLHTYKDSNELRHGFMSREVNAANDVTSSDIATIRDSLPVSVVSSSKVNNGVYAFMKTDGPILKDIAVRKALVLGTDNSAVIKKLYGTASRLYGPELTSQIGESVRLRQATFDYKSAKDALEKAGWVANGSGARSKGGQPLVLTLVAPKRGDFPRVAAEIASQWKHLGVDAKTQLVDPDTFEQNIIKPRSYDVLVYELALGADPDVFAYWHSSQATARGYNLSDYKSGIVDDALVSARSRAEPELRRAKYTKFTEQWLEDAPAIALYQPHMHYVTTEGISSIGNSEEIVDALNRYHQIETWTTQSSEQFRTP